MRRMSMSDLGISKITLAYIGVNVGSWGKGLKQTVRAEAMRYLCVRMVSNIQVRMDKFSRATSIAPSNLTQTLLSTQLTFSQSNRIKHPGFYCVPSYSSASSPNVCIGDPFQE